MVKSNKFEKYIRIVILAAVLLPLIFIAEVTYVEIQQAARNSQLQAEELAKLRNTATAAWISGQTAYIRGIAQSHGVASGEPDSMATELHAFLDAGTGFSVLGYAGTDGRTQGETSGAGSRYIGDKPFFTEAAAGHEYTGEIPGADWSLAKDATVVAVPVTVNGEIKGILYGLIPQETSEVMAVQLVPGVAAAEPVSARWFAWLGGVYLLGVIPLLLLVYFQRRHSAQTDDLPVPAPAVRKKHIVSKRQTAVQPLPEAAAGTQPAAEQAGSKASIQAAIAAVREHNYDRPKPAAAPDPAPAAAIDRVLAAAAYKAARPNPVAKQAGSAPEQFPVRQAPPGKPAVQVGQETFTQPSFPVMQAEQKQPDAAQAGKDEVRQASAPDAPRLVPVVKPAAAVAAKPPAPDLLTGLLPADEFEKILAARNGQPGTLIVTLSIDGMKVINDYLGEAAGDAVILAAADIIRAVAGTGCVAARMAGDQFAFLLPDSADGVEEVKKDVKYYIDLHNLRQSELPLSITIGAAAAAGDENLLDVWQKAGRDLEKHKTVNRVEARKFIMWSIKRSRGRS